MDLSSFLQNRSHREQSAPRFRELCRRCLQPPFGCYCAGVERFDPGIDFVILIHPMEMKRRIATGRMSHLCLESSYLLPGKDFSRHAVVNSLLEDPQRRCVVLYPGPDATNLSNLDATEIADLTCRGRRLTVFVMDGTWRTVRPMLRSSNLAALPRISFSLDRKSGFQSVRKQPKAGFFSTIEAIHQTIDLVGPDRTSRRHDSLLRIFDAMVTRQLDCVNQSRVRGREPSCR